MTGSGWAEDGSWCKIGAADQMYNNTGPDTS
jgi:hypothetical protein